MLTYRCQASGISKREKRLWVACSLAGFFPLAAAAALQGYYGYTHYGPASAWPWSQPWLQLAFVFACLGLILYLHRLLRTTGACAVSDSGIELRKPLSRPRFIPWNQISGIAFAQQSHLASPAIKYHDAFIHLSSQGLCSKRINLAWYCPNHLIPELITHLKARLYPRIEPYLRETLNRESAVRFGPLSLVQDGIHTRQRFVSWKDIRKITVESGCLVINTRSVSMRYKTIRIPNLEILLSLASTASSSASHHPI